MKPRTYNPLWPALVLVMLALSATQAQACSVPVFRWALERWQPEPYPVVVFTKGPLQGADRSALDALTKAANPEDCANLYVTTVDLNDKPDETLQKLWEREAKGVTPWATAHMPSQGQMGAVYWSGKLSDLDPKVLVDSPGRQALGKALGEGTTLVWVLIEGPDKQKNDDLAGKLEGILRKIEKEGADLLPKPEPGAPVAPGPPLKVAFSVVRVNPQDPKELHFVRMLTHSHPEGAAQAGKQAELYPVFGRGRNLGRITHEEASEEVIVAACGFLLGPCMCEIKEQNPGTDLLIKKNWDLLFFKEPDATSAPAAVPEQKTVIANAAKTQEPAPAPALAPTPNVTEVKPAPAVPPATANESQSSPYLLPAILAAAGLLIVLGSMLRKKS